MTTVVRFRAPGGQYALPVDNVTEIRTAADIARLPAPRPGVVGLVSVDGEALPVLSLLGATGQHIVVVEDGDETFALLVEEVLGVSEVPESNLGPPPAGQDRAVVASVVSDDVGMVQLLDIAVLSGRVTGR
jgi:chemotaxis signal transduction protein